MKEKLKNVTGFVTTLCYNALVNEAETVREEGPESEHQMEIRKAGTRFPVGPKARHRIVRPARGAAYKTEITENGKPPERAGRKARELNAAAAQASPAAMDFDFPI